MPNIPFVGRNKELKKLETVASSRVASLIVLKGRRRIGKTRLAEEFGKNYRTLVFTGLPPAEGVTAQAQRDHFSSQLSKCLSVHIPRATDWNDLFWSLADVIKKDRILVVFDEISWMGSGDPTFLGKLKTVWDTHYKKNQDLVLILSGSVSSWIEKNILSSTAFVGRISFELTLDELPLHRANEFWGNKKKSTSSYEKFKLLSVTGGVPRYLEEIIPDLSSQENIKRLCFERGGLLVNEYQIIFSDLFQSKRELYGEVVRSLDRGPCTQDELFKSLGKERGGRLGDYLRDLSTAGFISEDFTWKISHSQPSKLRKFRLSDNYIRFYLNYIQPNILRINSGRYKINPIQWSGIFGLQFENLILKNRDFVLNILRIDLSEVLFDGPYFQKKTKTHDGCQIDYLIQTRDGIVYICEIKFSKNRIGKSVINEVEKKRKAINLPKGMSSKAVLIHVNGVTPSVIGEEYFSQIIDFGQFLESSD